MLSQCLVALFARRLPRPLSRSLLALCLIFLGTISSVHAQPQSRLYLAQVSAALAVDCTLYASPSGSATNSGTSPSRPLSLRAAYQAAKPGSVVFLLPATYALTKSFAINRGGTAQAYVTYKSYDITQPAVLKWTGAAGYTMFQVANNAGYVEIRDLIFDGANLANVGIKCSAGSHHVRAIGNTINKTGAGGIVSMRCDYVTFVGNKIHLAGYGQGNSMGITLNTHVWFDDAVGFHSFVVNNIVAGSYDGANDTTREGNGISMDLGGNTPPVLIANNLVYMNGGRCISTNQSNNHWVINNTCYANVLDSKVSTVGNYNILRSSNVRLINNVAEAWTKGNTFKQHDSSGIRYYRNTHNGGKGLSGINATQEQIWGVAPRFNNPIVLDPVADGQYANAPHPDQIGTRFQLQSDSPLINAGIDPLTVEGVTVAIKAGLEKYILTDINGTPRPAGVGWDIGAFEYTP